MYSVSALVVTVLILSIWNIVDITSEFKDEGKSGREAFGATLGRNPVSFILAIYTFIAMWFVLGLCGFHVYLVCTGQTTYEQLKRDFPLGSPYSRGKIANFLTLFCSSEASLASDHAPEPAQDDPLRRVKYIDAKEVNVIMKDLEMKQSQISNSQVLRSEVK